MTLRSPRGMPRKWWQPKPPTLEPGCFKTKTEALKEFADVNQAVIENYGGIDYNQSPSEFDAINHRYGLTGKLRARNIAEAMWAAIPPTRGAPVCLIDLDLEALNETSPTREARESLGIAFRLPDYLVEQELVSQEEEFYRQQYGFGASRKPHQKSLSRKDALKPRDSYTLWQKVGDHWVIERSYPGHYIRNNFWDDIKKSWKTSRPYGVFPQNFDPNKGLGLGALNKQGTHLKATSTKGWRKASPKTRQERRALAKRCGRVAFLLVEKNPTGGPDKLEFPIVSKGSRTCEADCRGLWAAKQRASQTGRKSLMKKATRIAKAVGCEWVKGE